MARMDKAVLNEVAELQEGFTTLPEMVLVLDHLLLGLLLLLVGRLGCQNDPPSAPCILPASQASPMGLFSHAPGVQVWDLWKFCSLFYKPLHSLLQKDCAAGIPAQLSFHPIPAGTSGAGWSEHAPCMAC